MSDRTFCNPLNLNYYIHPPGSGAREGKPEDRQWFRHAADPCVILFEDEYFLFCSKSKGYWVSSDLVSWEHIPLDSWEQLPNLFSYAPTAIVLDGVLYLGPGNSSRAGVFKTRTPRDPSSWEEMPGTGREGWGRHFPDAHYFYDEEYDRLYFSWGCSGDGYIHIQELDKESMCPVGDARSIFMPDVRNRGWERPTGPRGNHALSESYGYVEGSQLLKHRGTYYLVYALPCLGNAYCNGVYTADSIEGPYTLQPANPMTQKLTGFVPGSGHGEMFQDKTGNWWTATCATVWAYDRFERRISMFPAWIDSEGQIMSDTWLGDYPVEVSARRNSVAEHRFTGWHLLSYNKPATASSVYGDFKVANALDEDIRSWWSAASGKAGEYFQVDLGGVCELRALQVNVAEVELKLPRVAEADAKRPEAADLAPRDDCFRYRVYRSADGEAWDMLIDKGETVEDRPHDYTEMEEPVRARYVKIVNEHMPHGGHFALRGFRLFGQGPGHAPHAPIFSAQRDTEDQRCAMLEWQPVPGADFYVIRYGVREDQLTHSQQIYGETEHRVCSLTSGQDYWFTVDACNDSGYTSGKAPKRV